MKPKLIWIGNPNEEEKHKHDYRWIKDLKKRKEWMEKHYKEK